MGHMIAHDTVIEGIHVLLRILRARISIMFFSISLSLLLAEADEVGFPET